MRQLVVNTSGPVPPERTGVPFHDARVIAAEADVPVVSVLAPTAYLENLSAPWSARLILEDGVLAYPVPAEAPLSWVATADVGLAAVRAVAKAIPGRFALPGVTYTGHELAGELGDALGLELRWETITPREFGERLRPFLRRPRRRGHRGGLRADGRRSDTAATDPRAAIEALGWEPRRAGQWAADIAWPVARV